MMDQTNISKYSPDHKDSPKPPYPTTLVPDNIRAPPLDSERSMKTGGVWNIKHEIRSPKFYEFLIKI